MVRDAAGNGAAIPFGPVGWGFVAYSFLLALVNVAALVWLFVHSPRHRWLAALMIAVQIVSRVLFIQQGISTDPLQLPFNAPVLALPYAVYAVALFAFHIFDPLVMAHRTAIEQLDVGVLALDGGRRVIDMNPAAERAIQLPLDRAKGRLVGDLLPAHADGIGRGAALQTELSLGAPPQRREYTLEVSPLKDWRGVDVGSLLLLHDVTEQKRAQAQIVAQQRALATLQERERLARELHDGAGQMFGYVSLQAQAINKLLGDGHLAAAEGQLARLADVASAAHTDLRESILSLKAGAGPSPGFLAALRQYLAAYQNNYGIAVDLSVDGTLGDDDFAPDTTAQLLRVITEALTNARRHGQASHVAVSLARVESMAHVTIADDGRGFDTGEHGNGAGDHFGLAFMRERMAQVGGSLDIDSRPGAGTCVTLDVPLRVMGEVEAQ
jgi:signal transduction histidine kinase